jgi:hypothetical protein
LEFGPNQLLRRKTAGDLRGDIPACDVYYYLPEQLLTGLCVRDPRAQMFGWPWVKYDGIVA